MFNNLNCYLLLFSFLYVDMSHESFLKKSPGTRTDQKIQRSKKVKLTGSSKKPTFILAKNNTSSRSQRTSERHDHKSFEASRMLLSHPTASYTSAIQEYAKVNRAVMKNMKRAFHRHMPMDCQIFCMDYLQRNVDDKHELVRKLRIVYNGPAAFALTPSVEQFTEMIAKSLRHLEYIYSASPISAHNKVPPPDPWIDASFEPCTKEDLPPVNEIMFSLGTWVNRKGFIYWEHFSVNLNKMFTS
jgi:hypothetical protein